MTDQFSFLKGQIPVLLAPMSGVTDAPFRKQAEKFGATATITEMVAGEELLAGSRDAQNRMTSTKDTDRSGPFIIQLIGREEAPMRTGAELATKAGADIIDINMGCPSRRVTGGLSGSALMKDLEHARRILIAVLEGAGGTPVTLKMRLGWDRTNLCAPELARIAENVGIRMLTVHGRTRQEFYEGNADWKAISDVVQATQLPVIANGDISDLSSARKAMKESRALGLMVGRAATGRAWLPAAMEQAIATNSEIISPSLSSQISSLVEQAKDGLELYGDRVGIRTIRKHVAAAFDWWIADEVADRESLQRLKLSSCRANSLNELQDTLFKVPSAEREMAV